MGYQLNLPQHRCLSSVSVHSITDQWKLNGFITTLSSRYLTFHQVVQVAVVGAMVFNGIPGLRDGHGLHTEIQVCVK